MDNWLAEIVEALPDSIMITQEIGPLQLISDLAGWTLLALLFVVIAYAFKKSST